MVERVAVILVAVISGSGDSGSGDSGSGDSGSGGDGSVVEFETPSGVFGSIAGNVVVVGGVDMITWDGNDSVQVIYGVQTLDRLAVTPTRSTGSSDLIPFIGGFYNIVIPKHLRGVGKWICFASDEPRFGGFEIMVASK